MKEMLGGCCVCADENGWQSNPLVYCDGPGCEVAVHQGCYGIIEVPDGEWFCAKCIAASRLRDGNNAYDPAAAVTATDASGASNGSNGGDHALMRRLQPRCALCPSGVGALKRTSDKGWAHVICALYIPEVRFGDVHSMDPVIIHDVPEERFQRSCYICEELGDEKRAQLGACMSCNRPGCKKSFHVTCAQQRGLLCEEGGGSKNVKYCGYCAQHAKKAAGDPLIKIIPPYRFRGSLGNDPNSTTTTTTPPQPSRPAAAAGFPPSTANGPSTMLADPLHRSVRQSSVDRALINSMIGQSLPSDPSALLDDGCSPPVSSGRSSTNQNTSPPPPVTFPFATMSTPGGGHVKSSEMTNNLEMLASASSTVIPLPSNLTQLANAATSQVIGASSSLPSSVSELSNHNRMPTPKPLNNGSATVTPPPRPSSQTSYKAGGGGSSGGSSMGSSAEKKPDGIPVPASTNATPSAGPKSHSAAKRSRPTDHLSDKPKRPRPSKKDKTQSMKALLDLVGPVVTDTVNDFQRDRVAAQNAAAAAAAAAAIVAVPVGLGGNDHLPGIGALAYPVVNAGSPSQASSSGLVGVPLLRPTPKLGLGSPDTVVGDRHHANPVASTSFGFGLSSQNSPFPTSLEQLLERQWEQGSQFLMGQAQHFDIASLLSCLHQLKMENQRLEENMMSLVTRRDHLLAVNARLTLSLGSQSNRSNCSPHHSPHMATATSSALAAAATLPGLGSASTSAAGADELSQLRSLAASTAARANAAQIAKPQASSSSNNNPMNMSLLLGQSGSNYASSNSTSAYGGVRIPSNASASAMPATTSAMQGVPLVSTVSSSSASSPDRNQLTAAAIAASALSSGFLVPRTPTPLMGSGASQLPYSGQENMLALIIQAQQQQAMVQMLQQAQQARYGGLLPVTSTAGHPTSAATPPSSGAANSGSK